MTVHVKSMDRVRSIRREFITLGLSAATIARKHGVPAKTVQGIARHVAVQAIPGDPPEECRLGMFKGYREIVEPLLVKYGVTWAQFMGTSRMRRISKCRWHAWSELADVGKKYIHIGKFCGRDHTTVIHGVKRFRAGGEPYVCSNFYWGA